MRVADYSVKVLIRLRHHQGWCEDYFHVPKMFFDCYQYLGEELGFTSVENIVLHNTPILLRRGFQLPG